MGEVYEQTKEQAKCGMEHFQAVMDARNASTRLRVQSQECNPADPKRGDDGRYVAG